MKYVFYQQHFCLEIYFSCKYFRIVSSWHVYVSSFQSPFFAFRTFQIEHSVFACRIERTVCRYSLDIILIVYIAFINPYVRSLPTSQLGRNSWLPVKHFSKTFEFMRANLTRMPCFVNGAFADATSPYLTLILTVLSVKSSVWCNVIIEETKMLIWECLQLHQNKRINLK